MQKKELTRQPSISTPSKSGQRGQGFIPTPVEAVSASQARNGTGSGSRSRRIVDQTNGDVASQRQQLDAIDEVLETERSELLAEKQALLGGVSDRHDDLVRELFHMQNFVYMVGYNPVEAKADNSAVFNEFKSQFSLLNHAASTTGPSRQTRRRANETRQLLGNSSSASAPSTSSSLKKRGKAKSVTSEELLKIISRTKTPKKSSKLKEGKAGSASSMGMDVDEPTVGNNKLDEGEALDLSTSAGGDTVHVRRKIRKPEVSSISQPFSTDEFLESISKAPAERKATKRRWRDDSPPPLLSLETTQSLPCISDDKMKENVLPLPIQSDDLPQNGSTRRSGRRKSSLIQVSPPKVVSIKVRPPVKDYTSTIDPQASSQNSKTISVATASPSKYGIKRIKLIVRRPGPQLSNPKQRAPEPKFGSSIDKLLSSYICVDEEGESAQPSGLEKEALEEAKLREDVDKLRRQGRFAPRRPRDETGDEETDEEEVEHITLKRTSKDLWDAVVEEVITRKKRRGRGLSRQVTSSIASKVQAHFDAIEAKKTKGREVEERRLRAQAKATMKMVVTEWKKAVFYIREKQRQEEEEEERRLGHEHLDAILNQSGALLETQQGDLMKEFSRSRSGSIPEFGEEPEESDDNEEEFSHEDERLDDDLLESVVEMGAEQGDELEAEIEDGSSSMLLDGEFSTNPSTRSETPTTVTSAGAINERDEDEEAHELAGHLEFDYLQDNLDKRMVSPAQSLRRLINSSSTSPIRSPTVANSTPVKSITTPDKINKPHESQTASISMNSLQSRTLPLLGVVDDEERTTQKTSLQPNGTSGSLTITLAIESDLTIVGNDASESHPRFNQNDTNNAEQGNLDKTAGAGEEEESDKEETTAAQHTIFDIEDHRTLTEATLPEEDLDEGLIETPEYLKSYAYAPIHWDLEKKVTPPLLLRGVLRPYQQSGMEWLASLHTNKLNGILADEMGLGKTIQTIALLAHLACDLGIWGPHLIVVPTSVLLNWEMEFKKFLPGFRILSYHGNTKRRKELRQGWNDRHHFNVCITSYALASRDAHIFKRKPWYYMILDEAHMIKNFKSQRWNILLMFRSYRRLLLTGTPLQNNLTELWALLQFLMSGANFANLKEFGEWFSNPLEKAIEMGQADDDDTLQRVSKLHTVLRPYLLRRLKRDVEKELPSKFEHLMLCPLSKRQRFLYDEFMSRAQTRDALQSGVYQKIANILMQLRKVCNHPDLFEVRPIVTSFTMTRSAIADYEIKELLIRRALFSEEDDTVNLSVVGLRFIHRQNTPLLAAVETRLLDATNHLPYFSKSPGEPPPRDNRTIAGFRQYSTYQSRARTIARWTHIAYINELRCSPIPIYSEECLSVVTKMSRPILPFLHLDTRHGYLDNVYLVNKTIKSFSARAIEMAGIVNAFAFVTPAAVAQDLPRLALAGVADVIRNQPLEFDKVLHPAAVKLQIAFPEPSLLQYDCGKLQKLSSLLREKKAGGHRVLIFTQMTRILDILETFLNFHGYLYLRLDGATKIEDRQYITERFNADARVFCFISSSRSGGVGINLTGADTVVFYDSDFNPQMDRQCEDRAHRIGQIRDVHIYRFVSQFSVEEAMLQKANQKRSLDDLVIQKGEFDWRSLLSDESTSALTKALGDFEDTEDRIAAAAAAREEISLVGADEDDFGDVDVTVAGALNPAEFGGTQENAAADEMVDDELEEGGTVVEYMVAFVERDWEFFGEWRL
ncbi:SNF2 family N-terminal domain-containing protein [Crepidotus variabilis]|uniref:DNA helicase n=1 Tax=Crepidotus variabilis TaxID=179855 RepID=A0A9P6EJ28_9AGAR|nr:SNF2 family N-terminal domain-containing protein [Crepidotus variabilis]